MHLQSNTQTQYFPFISLMPSSDLYDGSTEMAGATEVKYSCCPALALHLLYTREESWRSGVGRQFIGRDQAQLCEAQPFKKRREGQTEVRATLFSRSTCYQRRPTPPKSIRAQTHKEMLADNLKGFFFSSLLI